jgi:hypothetical protein
MKGKQRLSAIRLSSGFMLGWPGSSALKQPVGDIGVSAAVMATVMAVEMRYRKLKPY